MLKSIGLLLFLNDGHMKANNILDSVKEVLEKRWGNAMYGTFIISWVIWNWDVIYITFFVDQDLIFETTGQLKIYYVTSQYSWDELRSVIWSLVRLLFGPAFATFVILWGIVEIDIFCYRKDVSNEIRKENERIKQKEEFLLKERKVLEEEQENVAIAEELRISLPEEKKWENEYKELSENDIFKKAMGQVKTCLYAYGGRIKVYASMGGIEFAYPSDYLAYLDANGLIEFFDEDKGRIGATKKGKYFLKKFMQDNAE